MPVIAAEVHQGLLTPYTTREMHQSHKVVTAVTLLGNGFETAYRTQKVDGRVWKTLEVTPYQGLKTPASTKQASWRTQKVDTRVWKTLVLSCRVLSVPGPERLIQPGITPITLSYAGLRPPEL